MLLPLMALSLHRIQILRAAEDAPLRDSVLHADPHRIGVLAELLHCGVLDERRYEISYLSAAQAVVRVIDDLADARRRKGREPRREAVDDPVQRLGLIS